MRYLAIILFILFLPACGLKGLSTGPDFMTPTKKAEAPWRWEQFCQNYDYPCQQTEMKRISLTDEHWDKMNYINRKYNMMLPDGDRTVFSMQDMKYVEQKREIENPGWQIDPERGNCADICVTKLNALLETGLFKPENLGLAQVINWDGTRHLVVLVYAKEKDYVLDNLHKVIWPWHKLDYEWVSITKGNKWYNVERR
jgi:predicted transglutaminase-like cysteine proteinase